MFLSQTHIYEAIPRVSQARRLLRAKHNREPTVPEIAALTEFSEERVAVVLAANVKPRSAEQKISFGDQQREDEETLLVSVVVSCPLPRVVWWGGKGRTKNSMAVRVFAS
jgi:DNA-directed RNA polymerase specialized sigma subunit